MTSPVRMAARRASAPNDAGGVLPWTLIRILVVLGVLGLVGHDVGSIAWTAFHQRETADLAAQDAASEWGHSRDARAARKAAADRVTGTNDSFGLTGYEVAADGSVTVTLHSTATTYLFSRIGFLRHWTSVTSKSTVEPPMDARR